MVTDCSHCSTGLFEFATIMLDSLHWVTSVGSEICKMDGDHQNIKIVAVPIICNAYAQLN